MWAANTQFRRDFCNGRLPVGVSVTFCASDLLVQGKYRRKNGALEINLCALLLVVVEMSVYIS